MGYVAHRCSIIGRNFEKEITNALLAREFDARCVGGNNDGGVDIEVPLFGNLRTLQCGKWSVHTFSVSKLYERLRRSTVAVFRFKEFPKEHPVIMTSTPVWMDHLVWERPGRDHSRAQLRAYLASRGLRPHEIEEACRLA